MTDIPWTRAILEEFKYLALLTEFEEMVLESKIKGWSRTRQAIEFNVSISTIDRTLNQLRVKYDNVCNYSELLPPRKKKINQTY